MKLTLFITGTLFAMYLLTGCAGKNPEQDPKALALAAIASPFEGGAITLHLTGTPDLNTVDGIPDSCTVLILQGKTADDLDSVFSDPGKVKALFSGSGNDGSGGLLQVDRYTVMPGQISVLHLDRVMYTRYVGIIAGYYPFPGKAHRIRYAIPVKLDQSGWLWPVWTARLRHLEIDMTLGKDSIIQSTPQSEAVQEELTGSLPFLSENDFTLTPTDSEE